MCAQVKIEVRTVGKRRIEVNNNCGTRQYANVNFHLVARAGPEVLFFFHDLHDFICRRCGSDAKTSLYFRDGV
jgi:hypothetical protein